MRALRSTWSLRTKITLLVVAVVAIALLIANLLIERQLEQSLREQLREKALDTAHLVAQSPLVVADLSRNEGKETVQQYTESVRTAMNVEFIVVMDLNGIRHSHPLVEKVGLHFVGGDEGAVLTAGREYVSDGIGTLGPSLRAFTPVVDAAGERIGAVAVGILLNDVEAARQKNRQNLLQAIGISLLAGLCGALLLANSVRRTLFGMEPAQIAKVVEERNVMLQSVREGIIAVDEQAQITLVNDAARRLLERAGVDTAVIGRNVDDAIPETRLADVLKSGNMETDQEQNINGITLLTNRVPLQIGERVVGAIATFRDKTELRSLAEQLTGVRLYAEALRAQAHEFMNTMHVILGMMHMGKYEELSLFIDGAAKQYQAEVGFVIRRIKEPVLAGFLLGKMSQAREKGIEFILAEEAMLPEAVDADTTRELVTIVGNLLDNALDAVAASPTQRVLLNFTFAEEKLEVEVNDSGCGIRAEHFTVLFDNGWSTKGEQRGIGLHLVQAAVKRLDGDIRFFSEAGKGTCFVVEVKYDAKKEGRND